MKVVLYYTNKKFSNNNNINVNKMISFWTSLTPTTTGSQQEAIKSWINSGIVEINSVNVHSEIEKLQQNPIYKTVRFHEIKQSESGLQQFGRPYVRLNSLLQVALSTGADKIVLLNSDIILNPTWTQSNIQNMLKTVWDKVGVGLRPTDDGVSLRSLGDANDVGLRPTNFDMIYMHRCNFNNQQYAQTHYFPHGVDIFFMSKRFMSSVPQTSFLIGQPWYDIFMPKWCSRMGMRIADFNSPLWLHRNHHSTWKDGKGYQIFRKEHIRLIGNDDSRLARKPVQLGTAAGIHAHK